MVAEYVDAAAKVVPEGDQTRPVTVYCAGTLDAKAESETGVAPVTGATRPVTPADVIAVAAGADVAGKVTVKVSVLPEPVPDTIPALAVPALTVGVI